MADKMPVFIVHVRTFWCRWWW